MEKVVQVGNIVFFSPYSVGFTCNMVGQIVQISSGKDFRHTDLGAYPIPITKKTFSASKAFSWSQNEGAIQTTRECCLPNPTPPLQVGATSAKQLTV